MKRKRITKNICIQEIYKRDNINGWLTDVKSINQSMNENATFSYLSAVVSSQSPINIANYFREINY